MKMTIAISKLEEANRKSVEDGGKAEVRLGTQRVGSMSFDAEDVSKDYLRGLLTCNLTYNQKTVCLAALGDIISQIDRPLACANDFFKVMKGFENPNAPTVEYKIGDTWHPVMLSGVNYYAPNEYDPIGSMHMEVNTKICDQSIRENFSVGRWSFTDEAGNPCKKTARELMEEVGLCPTNQERIDEQQKQMIRAEQLRDRNGLVLDVNAGVLAINKMLWRSTLDTCRLATKDKVRQVIVENELEIKDGGNHSYYGRAESRTHELPFIRAFSVDLKKYVYVHVDSAKEHVFSSDARGRLTLPDHMHAILNSVFDTPAENIFGDMFTGRHGGMVILANGPTGTGKTLTAEVFAEHTHRPLYIMEMGELGTNLSAVEENLQKIFARASRWNAVLLFDECDVFLAKREETNLERSAIVGVFLRLLDRYEGMFFLTSNRGDVIDPAFKGRITLKLDYPALDEPARTTIWANMISAANLTLKGDVHVLGGVDMNGRQIRNQVRLLKILFPKGSFTVEEAMSSMRYVTK